MTSTTSPLLGGNNGGGRSSTVAESEVPVPAMNVNPAAKPCRCFFSSDTSSMLSVSPLDVTSTSLALLQYVAINGESSSIPSRTMM